MNKTYLIHHGIKGQKWGDRQAEWYPIDEYKAAQNRDLKRDKAIAKKEDRLSNRQKKEANKYRRQEITKNSKKQNTLNDDKKAYDKAKTNKQTAKANELWGTMYTKQKLLEAEFSYLSYASCADLLADKKLYKKDKNMETIQKLTGVSANELLNGYKMRNVTEGGMSYYKGKMPYNSVADNKAAARRFNKYYSYPQD